MGNEPSTPPSPHVRADFSDKELQQRGLKRMPMAQSNLYKSGTSYDIKAVVMGSHGSGKSSLGDRLLGREPQHIVEQGETIRILSYYWTHKSLKSNVKVDIWEAPSDEVFKAATPDEQLANDIKNQLTPSALREAGRKKGHFVFESSPSMDKEMFFRGTACVLVCINIMEKESFRYAFDCLKIIPKDTIVSVVFNFRDAMNELDAAGALAIKSSMNTFEEEAKSRFAESFEDFRIFEASTKNGFGIELIHRYMGIPIFMSQISSLEKQLERARLTLNETVEDISSGAGRNYDEYAKEIAKKATEVPTPAVKEEVAKAKESPAVPPSRLSAANRDSSRPEEHAEAPKEDKEDVKIENGAGPVDYVIQADDTELDDFFGDEKYETVEEADAGDEQKGIGANPQLQVLGDFAEEEFVGEAKEVVAVPEEPAEALTPEEPVEPVEPAADSVDVDAEVPQEYLVETLDDFFGDDEEGGEEVVEKDESTSEEEESEEEEPDGIVNDGAGAGDAKEATDNDGGEENPDEEAMKMMVQMAMKSFEAELGLEDTGADGKEPSKRSSKHKGHKKSGSGRNKNKSRKHH